MISLFALASRTSSVTSASAMQIKVFPSRVLSRLCNIMCMRPLIEGDPSVSSSPARSLASIICIVPGMYVGDFSHHPLNPITTTN